MSKWDSSPLPELAGRLALILLAVASLYFIIADIRYRLKHPEMTETQLLLNLDDIVLWRD